MCFKSVGNSISAYFWYVAITLSLSLALVQLVAGCSAGSEWPDVPIKLMPKQLTIRLGESKEELLPKLKGAANRPFELAKHEEYSSTYDAYRLSGTDTLNEAIMNWVSNFILADGRLVAYGIVYQVDSSLDANMESLIVDRAAMRSPGNCPGKWENLHRDSVYFEILCCGAGCNPERRELAYEIQYSWWRVDGVDE